MLSLNVVNDVYRLNFKTNGTPYVSSWKHVLSFQLLPEWLKLVLYMNLIIICVPYVCIMLE